MAGDYARPIYIVVSPLMATSHFYDGRKLRADLLIFFLARNTIHAIWLAGPQGKIIDDVTPRYWFHFVSLSARSRHARVPHERAPFIWR